MSAKLFGRVPVGKLELLLGLAIATLLLQLFPSAARAVFWMLDVRNWPRTVWFWLNFAAIFALFGIRFGPGLLSDWRERKSRLKHERETVEAQIKRNEQRETLERIREGRRRRLY